MEALFRAFSSDTRHSYEHPAPPSPEIRQGCSMLNAIKRKPIGFAGSDSSRVQRCGSSKHRKSCTVSGLESSIEQPWEIRRASVCNVPQAPSFQSFIKNLERRKQIVKESLISKIEKRFKRRSKIKNDIQEKFRQNADTADGILNSPSQERFDWTRPAKCDIRRVATIHQPKRNLLGSTLASMRPAAPGSRRATISATS